jgi:hypothetical protein
LGAVAYQAENSRNADAAQTSDDEVSGFIFQAWALFADDIDPPGLASRNRLSMPILLAVPFHPEDARRASSDADAATHAQVRIYFHHTARFADADGASGAKGYASVAGSVFMTHPYAAVRFCLHGTAQGRDKFLRSFE